MKVIPAIDIEENKVARLYKGNYNRVTFYKDTPAFFTKKFIEFGAKRIHLIMLSGAKKGHHSKGNQKIIEEVIETKNRLNPKCEIQLGGGIRKPGQVRHYLSTGIDFVIMGTSLLVPILLENGYTIQDLRFLYQQAGKDFKVEKESPEIEIIEKLNKDIKKRIIVAIDFINNEIGLSGWNVTVPILPEFLIQKFIEKGFSRFLITNIERDGTLEGIDIVPIGRVLIKIDNIREKIEEIIISGGVKDENDIIALNSIGYKIDGVVIGKAIYDRTIDIKKVISTFQD